MSQNNSTSSPKATQIQSGTKPISILPDIDPSPEDPVAGAARTLFNRPAEEATIGAVLINPDCFGALAEMLKPSDFYIRRNGWIWQVYLRLLKRAAPIDFLTVVDELEHMGMLEEVGGPAYLTSLLNQVPNSLNAEAYARSVQEYATRRGLIAAAGQVATLAYDEKRTLSEVTACALEAIHSQTTETERARFTVRNAAFAMQLQPPIDYIVDNLLTNASVTCFYGEAGSKKTYTALSLAVSVASGRPWLDFETNKSAVLIVDEESGERRFSRRLNAAIRGQLCQDENLPLYYVSLAGFKLDENADPVILQGLVKSTGARLLIIDALADVMSGDENAKEYTQPVFNHLRKIAEATDCSILVIHHAGKNGGYRGSSAIKGAVDLMVQIQSENGSNFVNFKSEKNRDGTQMSWAAEAVWTADQFYLQPAAHSLLEHFSPSEEYVNRYLAEHGPALVCDIKANADQCSPEAARTAVYRLASRKKITRTNPGAKGEARYAIA